jgi:hypothetical protein
LSLTPTNKHIDGDIDSMNSKSPSEIPFPFRARQGFRPPSHHSHQHILRHNWAARGRPMLPQMRSGATATALASAPAITQTGTEAEGPYHGHQRHGTYLPYGVTYARVSAFEAGEVYGGRARWRAIQCDSRPLLCPLLMRHRRWRMNVGPDGQAELGRACNRVLQRLTRPGLALRKC